MKKHRLIPIVILSILSGCTPSCEQEIVKYVAAIGSIPIVQKRIAGIKYIKFSKGDPKDTYSSQNGFLCVTHNPGCNWFLSSGNSGTDQFFDNLHPLPPGCKVEGVMFTQYWPKDICSSGSGGLFGRGSYGAQLEGGGSYPYLVTWNNACQADFGGRNLSYTISFVVSMPEGADLGEDVFDVNSTTSLCQPSNYLTYHPDNCVTPAAQCSILRSTTYSLNLAYVRREGLIVYSGTLSINNGCTGTVTSITNGNLYLVTLEANGKSVDLAAGKSTTSADLSNLYGSGTPNLPVVISIHPSITIDPSLIASILISVTYSYYE